MKTEHVDSEFGELLEKATPEMEAGWEARASAATSAARPAARKPWRWAMAAAGLAALIGLGFVPVRTGEATGALGRAVAALDGARGVHVVARGWSGGNEYRFEEWSTADGDTRYDQWRNGALWLTRITCVDWILFYDASSAIASAFDLPPAPEANRWPPKTPSTREGLGSKLQYMEEHLDGSWEEWREDSLLGRPVDVIEAIGHVKAASVLSGIPYESAGMVCVLAEIDVDTDRLISLREYRDVDGSWELTFETQAIEWDAEIPDSVWEFEPPAGTEFRGHTWWTGRADQELASGYAGDWKVVLHALDVNRYGDVAVTLSRWLPEADWDSEVPQPQLPRVTVVDDRGIEYTQALGCGCVVGPAGGYWILNMSPEGGEDGPAPQSITLTIGSEEEAQAGHEPVTFRYVPLPPRQDVEGVFEATTEVIQY